MGHCHGSSMKYTLFFKSYFVNVLLLVNLIFMIFLLKLFLYIEQLKGDFFGGNIPSAFNFSGKIRKNEFLSNLLKQKTSYLETSIPIFPQEKLDARGIFGKIIS